MHLARLVLFNHKCVSDLYVVHNCNISTGEARQKDSHMFQASLSCIVSYGQPWTSQQISPLNKQVSVWGGGFGIYCSKLVSFRYLSFTSVQWYNCHAHPYLKPLMSLIKSRIITFCLSSSLCYHWGGSKILSPTWTLVNSNDGEIFNFLWWMKLRTHLLLNSFWLKLFSFRWLWHFLKQYTAIKIWIDQW